VEYDDTGGDGAVIVLLHGLLMDSSLWRHVISELRSDYRCVAPTLPLGGHRVPMRADSDLSLLGRALAPFHSTAIATRTELTLRAGPRFTEAQ